ncbi:hypothetical protein [Alteriqipengyuania lutimaris]|uniref:Uncharacterized protein n=1 Tax=Alteriqipengyuania lutimaris TaxID=1538146 RepID=A0A395LKI2_9SPHN|nr:hypothetical protein [Alteriqipengyuania lutimaris]MBB3035393.1 chemotaxis methyl-accepting protein methylase [Alteriqipengyuania lutimaris]RDS75974.1 hypothetical protein DL238_14990 [Alteriqipengyuania lutimaris]
MPHGLTQQTKPSLEQQLTEAQAQLDEVLGEVTAGIRNPTHFDQLEERGNAIGAGIRRAFRGER